MQKPLLTQKCGRLWVVSYARSDWTGGENVSGVLAAQWRGRRVGWLEADILPKTGGCQDFSINVRCLSSQDYSLDAALDIHTSKGSPLGLKASAEITTRNHTNTVRHDHMTHLIQWDSVGRLHHVTITWLAAHLGVWHGKWNLPRFVQINFNIRVRLLTKTKDLQGIRMQPQDYVLKHWRKRKKTEARVKTRRKSTPQSMLGNDKMQTREQYLNSEPSLTDSSQEKRQHGLQPWKTWRSFGAVFLCHCMRGYIVDQLTEKVRERERERERES